MLKLFITKRISKTSGKEYLALVADLGYKEIMLSFDTRVIYEMSPIPIAEIATLKTGERVDLI